MFRVASSEIGKVLHQLFFIVPITYHGIFTVCSDNCCRIT